MSQGSQGGQGYWGKQPYTITTSPNTYTGDFHKIETDYYNSLYVGGDNNVASELFKMYLSGVDIITDIDKYLEKIREFSWVKDNNLKAVEVYDKLKKMWNI